MPEATNNDAPNADRPTSRADQEAPGRSGSAARSPAEIEAERQARAAVQNAATGSTGEVPADGDNGSPTDTAP